MRIADRTPRSIAPLRRTVHTIAIAGLIPR
jgi:hypothetical protein